MSMSREFENEGGESRRDSYLLTEVGLGSPLNELKAIFEKKFRTAQNLGETEKGRQFQEAFEMARKRLATSLGVDPEMS